MLTTIYRLYRLGIAVRATGLVAAIFCAVSMIFGNQAVAETILTTTERGFWNGYLNHVNIVECSNRSNQTQTITLKIFGNGGGELVQIQESIDPLGTKHLPLPSEVIRNQYGSYVLNVAPGQLSDLNCFTMIYRFAAPGSSKPLEYGFALPLYEPTAGARGGVFNSMNASGDSLPVENWLTIFNPAGSAASFQLQLFDRNGISTKTVTVDNVQPYERRDLALAHDTGQSIGSYLIRSLSGDSTPFVAFLSRYGRRSLDRYGFAFVLPAKSGNCEPQTLPASTFGNAFNWAEILNAGESPLSVTIELFRQTGTKLLEQQISLNRNAQFHLPLHERLGANNVGVLRLSCQGGSLLAQSMYYGRLNSSPSMIEWAYASDGATPGPHSGEGAVSPINTFLGARNWQKFFNTANSPLHLQAQLFRANGSLISTSPVNAPINGSLDLGLHEFVGADAIGMARMTPTSDSSSYTSELIRAFYTASGEIGYILNIPLARPYALTDNGNSSSSSQSSNQSSNNGGASSGSSSSSSPATCANGVQDAGEENVDCGGACPICQHSVSQSGITWSFDRGYRTGQYANGDFWVRGPLRITRITPDFDGLHNGFDVNPNDVTKQAYDTRAAAFDPSLVPHLPYTALPGSSIVKTLALEPTQSAPRCTTNANHICFLSSAAVLTVVADVPTDSGEKLFRPPYFGAEKPQFNSERIRADLLPSVPGPSNAPSLQWMVDRFRPLQLDHLRNWIGQFIHPDLNMPDYGGDIALDTGDGALRLMLNDSYEAKRLPLIHYLQMGIDWYYIMKGGGSWPPNGGHDNGRKLPIIFAAILLDNQEMKDAVRTAAHGTFQEESSVYLSPLANDGRGKVLFGQGTVCNYWLNQVADHDSRTCSDPYGYIDGGNKPGESYQRGINSMIWKGPVVAMQLLPQIGDLWSEKENFIDYVDRWVTFGPWALPDPCAPTMGRCAGGTQSGQICTYANLNACPGSFCGGGRCSGGPYNGGLCSDLGGPSPQNDCGSDVNGRAYSCAIDTAFFGVTYGPDPAHPGSCIQDSDSSDGIGRHPSQHGSVPDQGGYQSRFVNEMWNRYRLYHCSNGVQDQDESGVDCGGTCGYDGERDGYVGRLCNSPQNDCNDDNSSINPGRPEICTQSGEFDDNCDGLKHSSYYQDGDGDAVNNCEDNCPGIYNPTQSDADVDGIGDPCDPLFQIEEDFEQMSNLNTPAHPGGLTFEIISGAATIGTGTHWGYQSKLLKLDGSPSTNVVVTQQGRESWSNYTLNVLVGQKYSNGGLVIHYHDGLNYYLINLRTGKLERVQNGVTTVISGSGDSIIMDWGGNNAQYAVEISTGGSNRFVVTKNGSMVATFVDPSPHISQGSIGFFERGHASGNYFIFDNLLITF